MKAEEIREANDKGQAKASTVQSIDGLESYLESLKISMLTEVAAQLAEMNEHLKRIAHPPLFIENGEINPESFKDAQPGNITFRPSQDVKTLRDEFARAAMAAIISRGDLDTEMNVMPYCQDAYTIADAMLEARKK
jgi:hypothetical protein